MGERGTSHAAAKLICVTGAPAAAPSEMCDPIVTFGDKIARHRVQTPGH